MLFLTTSTCLGVNRLISMRSVPVLMVALYALTSTFKFISLYAVRKSRTLNFRFCLVMWSFYVLAPCLLAAYIALFNYRCLTDVDCCVFTSPYPYATRYPLRILRAPQLDVWTHVLQHMVSVPGIPSNPQQASWQARQFLPPGHFELRHKHNSTQFEESQRELLWTVQEGTATIAVMSPRATDDRQISVELKQGQALLVPRGWWYAIRTDGLLAALV